MSDINIGALSEAINDKADRDLNNRSDDSGLRKLTESYVNGTDWYKVFDEIQSDGTVKQWCEQGGKFTTTAARYIEQTVTLLKTMSDTNYNFSATAINVDSGNYIGGAKIGETISTTQFTVKLATYENTTANVGFYWEVKGYIS